VSEICENGNQGALIYACRKMDLGRWRLAKYCLCGYWSCFKGLSRLVTNAGWVWGATFAWLKVGAVNSVLAWKRIVTWLILPVVICLSQRLSHACLIYLMPRLLEGVYLLDKKPTRLAAPLVIHNNFSNRMALCRRCFIQISALSTFDGRIFGLDGISRLGRKTYYKVNVC